MSRRAVVGIDQVAAQRQCANDQRPFVAPLNAARKAADFVLSQTVVDGDGIKMPHIVPLDPNAPRVVDLVRRER